jgi:hypothetical protein
MYMSLRDRYGPPDGLAVPRCPLVERWQDFAAPTRADGHPRPAVPCRPNRPGRTQCAMSTGVTATFESTWRVTPPRSSSRTRLCE